MSFPPGTEMFQFPGFAPPAYGFSGRYPCKHGWVAPFGDPRDQSLLAAPPGLSQRATSFIASWRQGIHQMPLLSLNPPSGNRAPPGESKRQRTTNTHHKARIPMPNCPRPANGKTKKKGAGEPCQHPSAHDPRQPPKGTARPRNGHHHHHLTMSKEHAPAAPPARPAAGAGTRDPHGRPGGPGHAPAPPARRAGLVGLGRLERPTSRLSGVRSDQLSYRPEGYPTDHGQAPPEGGAGHGPSVVCAKGRADGGGPGPPRAPGASHPGGGFPWRSRGSAGP